MVVFVCDIVTIVIAGGMVGGTCRNPDGRT